MPQASEAVRGAGKCVGAGLTRFVTQPVVILGTTYTDVNLALLNLLAACVRRVAVLMESGVSLC